MPPLYSRKPKLATPPFGPHPNHVPRNEMSYSLLLFRPEDDPPKKKVALQAFQILRFRAKDFVARDNIP